LAGLCGHEAQPATPEQAAPDRIHEPLEIRSRGTTEIQIAVVDGLKGYP
jgi:hypothetical protein